jgi:hypothetical protein
MSELTLLLLRIGFLLLLWAFVFVVVYSMRADLFGVRVRRMPEPAGDAAAAAGSAAAVASPAQVTAPSTPPVAKAPTPAVAPAASKPGKKGGAATTETVQRIVITSGPKAGLELPLTNEPLTIGRSSESGLVVRDDYTSSHHARLVLWGEQWMIQDLDSTNGTWHDGARVQAPTPVTIGAPIKVGATTFELRK